MANTNNMKWASIPLCIPTLLADTPRAQLRQAVFKQAVMATHKFDGTNVGKDEHGSLYGRNQTILPQAGAYQKTPLTHARAVNAAAIKVAVLDKAGIAEDRVGVFCVYGELMCNANLYSYSKDSLPGTHQVFGAMLQAVNPGEVGGIAAQLTAGGFACILRGGKYDDDDGEDVGEQADPLARVMVLLNEELAAILAAVARTTPTTTSTTATSPATASTATAVVATGFPTVPFAGRFKNLRTLVDTHYDHMVGGFGEGMVLTTFNAPGTVRRGVALPCTVSKWKNGFEGSSNNEKLLQGILEEIAKEGTDGTIFGEDTAEAVAMFTQMLAVEKSKLICGQAPAPTAGREAAGSDKSKKGSKQRRGGAGAATKKLTDAEEAAYSTAIVSAQSKFDHQDTFFAKKMKGAQEYSSLIAAECLNDIAVDSGDKTALKQHQAVVFARIKQAFVAFCRAQSATKK